jgi:uncharacterized protein with HEPN domain
LNIATAIGNIRKITNGLTRKSFANDLVVRLAVERLLEVISEASRHIPTEANAPRFTGDDLGNRLRHAYHETDAGLLWEMIQTELEPLSRFVERIARSRRRCSARVQRHR